MHVRKGDMVVVISGESKGARGEVREVDRKKDRVLVQGVNLRWRHQKPTQQSPKGERVQRESTIHVSNVMLIDPESGKPTRHRKQTEA